MMCYKDDKRAILFLSISIFAVLLTIMLPTSKQIGEYIFNQIGVTFDYSVSILIFIPSFILYTMFSCGNERRIDSVSGKLVIILLFMFIVSVGSNVVLN